jgi:hypothetical protein
MHANAKPQAKLANPLDDLASTRDRARRTVEGGEKAVACGVDLATTEAVELAADDGVMSLKKIGPGTIAVARPPTRWNRRCR